jgi:hypothetical protein
VSAASPEINTEMHEAKQQHNITSFQQALSVNDLNKAPFVLLISIQF